MPFTFDPSSAYGHVYKYLPGYQDASLAHRTPGGTVVGGYHRGYARHRTKGDSDYREWARAFVNFTRTAAFDWFAADSESGIAGPGDLFQIDGSDERWIVGQVNPGRWGSQQLLYVTLAEE